MKRVLLSGLVVCGALASAQALAVGDAQAGQQKAAPCAACHGQDGNSLAPNFPKLAGLGIGYLVKQLRDFKSGEARDNPLMAGQVAGLSEQDMEDLAAYYNAQVRTPGVAEEKLVDLGQTVYRGGITGSSVGACIGCHGPRGAGNPAAKFPAVSGQHAQYLAGQLMKFRAQQRANDPNHMMRNIAARMTDDEIKAVASYMSGLY